MSRLSTRDRILTTAAELFYQEGVQNVGIDRIVAKSGVAKMSLYNHFKSKDALIEAWLQQRDQQWRQWFQATVEQLAEQPQDRLLAIFDALKAWFEETNFRGCAFINSTIELANPGHPGCQVAFAHQQAVYHYVLSLCEAAELSNPEAIAQQLFILAQGAIVVAVLQGRSEVAVQAKQAATILLQTHSQGQTQASQRNDDGQPSFCS